MSLKVEFDSTAIGLLIDHVFLVLLFTSNSLSRLLYDT